MDILIDRIDDPLKNVLVILLPLMDEQEVQIIERKTLLGDFDSASGYGSEWCGVNVDLDYPAARGLLLGCGIFGY